MHLLVLPGLILSALVSASLDSSADDEPSIQSADPTEFHWNPSHHLDSDLDPPEDSDQQDPPPLFRHRRQDRPPLSSEADYPVTHRQSSTGGLKRVPSNPDVPPPLVISLLHGDDGTPSDGDSGVKSKPQAPKVVSKSASANPLIPVFAILGCLPVVAIAGYRLIRIFRPKKAHNIVSV